MRQGEHLLNMLSGTRRVEEKQPPHERIKGEAVTSIKTVKQNIKEEVCKSEKSLGAAT